MTKKEVKQLLPFNTITKCEKEYHRLVKESFNFGGFDTESYEILVSCVMCIYSSLKYDSVAQLEKFFAGKENRRKSYYFCLFASEEEQRKAIKELLFV